MFAATTPCNIPCFRLVFLPAGRQEQELYISELESQNRVPEGKEVVHPLPGFVIKTRFTRGSKDAEPEKVDESCLLTVVIYDLCLTEVNICCMWLL